MIELTYSKSDDTVIISISNERYALDRSVFIERLPILMHKALDFLIMMMRKDQDVTLTISDVEEFLKDKK